MSDTDDSNTDVSDDDDAPQAAAAQDDSQGQIATTPWTDDEVEALQEGVRNFGAGRWETILDCERDDGQRRFAA